MMDQEFYALLSGAVSFPVGRGHMGSGTSTPRAAFYATGALRDMHTQGLGLVEGRMQVDCYGKTAGEALDAEREVLTALEGYAGGSIQMIKLESRVERPASDVEILHCMSLSFSMIYRD